MQDESNDIRPVSESIPIGVSGNTKLSKKPLLEPGDKSAGNIPKNVKSFFKNEKSFFKN